MNWTGHPVIFKHFFGEKNSSTFSEQKKMKYTAIILALFAFLAVAFADVEYENEVAILTDDNFDEVIEENKVVFVMFYAP